MHGNGQTRTVDVPLNSTVHPEEAHRLASQSISIVRRLRQGTATNIELSAIALRYSARINELRNRGYEIAIVDRNRLTGVNVYELIKETDEPVFRLKEARG